MTDIEKLEAALKFVRKQYVDVAVNKTAPALVTDYIEQDIDEILEAARTHLNLLKAIEDKRLAVVPVTPIAKQESEIFKYKLNLKKDGDLDARAAYKAAISAVDQKQIIEELEG